MDQADSAANANAGMSI